MIARRIALVVMAMLLLAPAAEGRRDRLRGSVEASHGRAPKRWKTLTSWATATATPTPAPTPPPSGPAPTATPTPTPGSTLPPQNPRSVSVNSTEFAFALSQATVSAGEVRVQFDNSRAQDPHQLSIDGPDPDFWTFAEVGPGDVTQRTITLRPGRHVLVCPLPGHEQLGMRAVLTVR